MGRELGQEPGIASACEEEEWEAVNPSKEREVKDKALRIRKAVQGAFHGKRVT